MKLAPVIQIVLLLTLSFNPASIMAVGSSFSPQKLTVSKTELAPASLGPNEEGINKLKPALADNIDQAVSAYSDRCSGATIGLVYGGNIVYTKSYGTHKINEVRVWASVSKTLTTLITMRLVERGLITLNTPIWKYAPQYYSMIPDKYKVTPLTLQHLLTHRGGINHLGNTNTSEMFIAVPNTVYSYSSNGFGLVGEVLKTKLQKSFTTLVKTEIANQIGAPSLSAPNSFLAPAAFVESNIQDFSRYTLGIMQSNFVSENTLYNTILKPGNPSWQGLGFQIEGSGTGIAAMHAGSNGEAKAYMYIRPRQKRSVVFFCTANSDWSEVSPLKSLSKSIDDTLASASSTPCRDPKDCQLKKLYLPMIRKNK